MFLHYPDAWLSANRPPLTAGGTRISVGSHVAPRLADWNDDGALDLLVAGGDGHLWLFRQGKPVNDTEFLRGERLLADGKLFIMRGVSR